MDEEEKQRREKIVKALREFNEFLKNTPFTKDDIVVILKSFDEWRKGLLRAKKIN